MQCGNDNDDMTLPVSLSVIDEGEESVLDTFQRGGWDEELIELMTFPYAKVGNILKPFKHKLSGTYSAYQACAG